MFNKAHFIQMLHILACSITIQMSNTSSMHSGTLMLGFGFCTVDTQILLNGNNDVVFNASSSGSHAHRLGPPGAQPAAHPHAQPHQTGEDSLQLALHPNRQQIQGTDRH